MTDKQLCEIQAYCWDNYCPIETFLDSLQHELRGQKVAKIENQIITTTRGDDIKFNEII